MAIDTAELETLLDALIRARAAGLRSLLYEGKRVEYGSDAEMAAAIADLERRIRRASTSRPAAVMFSSSKGLG